METRENHVKFSISNYTGYLLFAGESWVVGPRYCGRKDTAHTNKQYT